jgi:hypothetical protein
MKLGKEAERTFVEESSHEMRKEQKMRRRKTPLCQANASCCWGSIGPLIDLSGAGE